MLSWVEHEKKNLITSGHGRFSAILYKLDNFFLLPLCFLVGLTIAGQNDFGDTITIAKSTIAVLLLLQVPIAILLLLPKALLQYYYYCRFLLQYYYYCQKHYCNTVTIAGSYCNTIAITIGNIICLKKTKDFHKALVLLTSSVEILFESHTSTIAVIFDELMSTCCHHKCCIF